MQCVSQFDLVLSAGVMTTPMNGEQGTSSVATETFNSLSSGPQVWSNASPPTGSTGSVNPATAGGPFTQAQQDFQGMTNSITADDTFIDSILAGNVDL